MKRIACLGIVAILAACSEAEKPPEPVEAEVLAVDGKPIAGSYNTLMDDQMVRQTFTKDGRVMNVDQNGIVQAEGRYTVEGGNKVCMTFNPAEPAKCYIQGEPGPDGSWTATLETEGGGDAEVWTVSRRS